VWLGGTPVNTSERLQLVSGMECESKQLLGFWVFLVFFFSFFLGTSHSWKNDFSLQDRTF
jgi:hypothetical protein